MDGQTIRVSLDSAGNEPNDSCGEPAVSADGRFVTFQSFADNLVADDANGVTDIFVRDVLTDTTVRVSMSALSDESNDFSVDPVISADGRYIAFRSKATNLTNDNDTNLTYDIFIRAFPEPVITHSIPNMLPIGSTTSVTVSGHYFFEGTELLAGAYGTVTNQVIVDENTITADISIPSNEDSGARNLMVKLVGSNPAPGTGAMGICEDCVTLF
ncbi:MAG: hypothetical protein U5K56_20690 [Halioglobus sp.]|nr:hypothetical protein [Halioglobus sp.]